MCELKNYNMYAVNTTKYDVLKLRANRMHVNFVLAGSIVGR